MAPQILTIGHGTHPVARFFEMAAAQGVTALVDVRTSPWSRFAPQYNRPSLAAAAATRGMAYVFLGVELGGRPSDPALVDAAGTADYRAMAGTDAFAHGIGRVREGVAKGYRIALVCSERDCLDCHRNLLVARALACEGLDVAHIGADGGVEDQAGMEARLLAWAGRSAGLFEAREEALDGAYLSRARKVAWRRPEAPRA